jgi:hypothetical protein
MESGAIRKFIAGASIGGEVCADIMFQLATRDPNKEKDWPAICRRAQIQDVMQPKSTTNPSLALKFGVADGLQPNFGVA